MCECLMLASGEFEPILIIEKNMGLYYIDKNNTWRTLIEKFPMEVDLNKVSVSVEHHKDSTVTYTFTLKGKK